MKRSRAAMATFAAVALAACAGLALAQAPDWGPPPGRGPGFGPPRGGRGMAGPQMGRSGVMALAPLVAGEDVQTEISNTDNGVNLTIRSTDKEKVGALQNRVRAGVDRISQTAGQMGQRMAQRGRNARGPRRNPMMLLAAGDVALSVKEVDDGVVVSFTSDDPDTVKALQEQMPQWVATAQQQGRLLVERRRQMQAARELLANEAVKVEVSETENGIVVKVTSDDPELAKQLKETLPAYFEAQAEMARRAGQMAGRGRGPGPGGPGFGPRGGRGFGGGGRGRGGRPGGPPADLPEF